MSRRQAFEEMAVRGSRPQVAKDRERHDSDSSGERISAEAMPIRGLGAEEDAFSASNAYRYASSSDNGYVMKGCQHCHDPCIDLDVSDTQSIFCSGECRLSHLIEKGRPLV